MPNHLINKKEAPPAEVIRLKKPRPARRIFLTLLAIFLLVGIIWAGRFFWLMSQAASGRQNQSPNFFSLFGASSLKGASAGRINLLLIGIGGLTHPKGGNLADSIIFASVNAQPSDRAVATVSIPRDLLVDLPAPFYGQEKINAVHSYGEREKAKAGSGPELLKKAVEEISGQTVHYWARIDFEGFKKLVDSAGGITVKVEKEIYDPYFPADNLIDYKPFSLKAGSHRLDGVTALKYARSRYTTSDFDRSSRQQQIIQAIRDEYQAKGYYYRPDKILEVVKIINQHLKTNMSLTEISELYGLVKDIPKEKYRQAVLDNSDIGPLKTISDNGYYLVPKAGDWSEIKQIFENIFSSQINDQENAGSQE